MHSIFQAVLGPVKAILLVVISATMYSLGLRFPNRKWLILAPLLYCHYQELCASIYWPKESLDGLWGLSICLWTIHSLSVLYLEDHSFMFNDKQSFRHQPWYRKGWNTWNNPRLLFTSRAERKCDRTPPPPASNQAKYPLIQFVLFRSAKLGIYCILLFHIQPQFVFPGPFEPLDMSEFDAIRQTYFRRILFPGQDAITLRETSLRSIFAFIWAIGAYFLLDGAHCTLSLLFVAVLGVNSPEEWPPIFGSLYHTYSLRAFWGSFWHRLVVLPYGNIGKLFAQKLLGLQPKSLSYNLVLSATIFGLSGITHSVASWIIGDHCWHLEVWWFLLNFVATAAESLCVMQLRQILTPLRKVAIVRLLLNHITLKILGYLWVYLFFFWSVPKWQYPKIHAAFEAAYVEEDDFGIQFLI